ncbi:MAG: alpha/beta hydrolase [Actinobacteria bacterium]|nr:alpha/beta hydrolase [Actinomycetota bacterium]
MASALGFDSAGEGPVLMLVHGFPFDRTMWSAQLSDLSSNRRVVAIDLPGRGKSQHVNPDGMTMDDYAEAVAETIDSLGVEKVDLAGLSMGGYVVFALWRKYPERVRSLIFIDTKAGDDAPEAKEGREKTAALVRENGTAALLDSLFPKLFAPDTAEAIKAKVRRMFEDMPAETAASDALAMRDRPDSTVDLASITVPVLVIHGEQDQLMPIDGAKSMAGLIPGARFAAIAQGGHMSPLEDPVAVNQALNDFLGD